ncbi:hypothetical protein OG777_15315 [Micromonospora peucetia]|uniref:Thymidylate kinase n=1 Tax=Micromonospora peucetia TaxID=47871 RepID=A0A1C6VSL1_9ACTN|nr:hypothetical protein [Micromonospora peucetia]MCX4388291.1 hypothetical protein [Micromonospora peucetia]WSA31037.1 hypothetical protein OIE14_23155 [Micromonospora peucetia]SCL69309.1 hypothetical protein GA0070608_3973 [Micromonospora peucetia]
MDRWSWFPQPSLVCFLTVSPERARQRVLARGIDTEELAHLRALDAGCRGLPEFGTFTVIDVDGEPSEVGAALDRVVRAALAR